MDIDDAHSFSEVFPNRNFKNISQGVSNFVLCLLRDNKFQGRSFKSPSRDEIEILDKFQGRS
uniref:Uncharacterized protein n=1 Tax=Arundo donax TaxID=35708 RepID=A0A0A9HXC8_ARUDO